MIKAVYMDRNSILVSTNQGLLDPAYGPFADFECEIFRGLHAGEAEPLEEKHF